MHKDGWKFNTYDDNFFGGKNTVLQQSTGAIFLFVFSLYDYWSDFPPFTILNSLTEDHSILIPPGI